MKYEMARNAIEEERARQIAVEGWTLEHDDEHSDGEMLSAAIAYYMNGIGRPISLRPRDSAPLGWPWDVEWWKPKTPERDLVRAGALCLAEIDRLRRIKGSNVEHVQVKLRMIIAALDALALSPQDGKATP